MQHFYVLVGLGLLVAVGFVVSVANGVRQSRRQPYRVDDRFLAPPRQAFAEVLERAVGPEYRVYAKVRAADVIGVDSRIGRRQRERAELRLADHRFDFLVCTRAEGAIVCAVNLATASRFARRPRRTGLDRLCAAAGLPFVRFREGEVDSVAAIEGPLVATMGRRRMSPRGDEPTARETREALGDLSAAIRGTGRVAPRGELPPPPPATLPAAPRPPSPPIPIKPKARTEPRMRVDEDLDVGPEPRLPGPRFEVELEEDRPRRARM